MKLIPTSLKDFNDLAEKKINLKINVVRPYKFCDFKPSFGVIFEDYLEGYTFWGFCDIDLVLGKVTNFITKEILDNNDVISVRHDYTSGFFMLFRNIPKVNNLFRESKDYEKIFLSNDNFCFDECNYKYEYIQSPEDIIHIDCEIESMLEVIIKQHIKGNIRAFFDFLVIEGTPGKLFYDNGKLVYNNSYEVLLYHFVSLKYNIFTKVPNWKEIPNSYFIDSYTFCKKRNLWSVMKSKWNNVIWPSVFINFLKLNRAVSVAIYKKPFNRLKPGLFFLGETILEVKKNIKTNTIIREREEYSVFGLLLMPSYFFIENTPYCYKIPDYTKESAENFIEIRRDGNTSKFDLRK
nr:DUF6625 family protein [Salegentibacter sp. Hel_I_6]